MLDKVGVGDSVEMKPYQGPKSPFALDEIFVQDAFANDDERLWMPVTPYSWSRPLCLCASQGYWVHLSKFRGSGVVSCHRHPAPVHGFIIKGGWRYLEHDWVGTAGSYVFEPPGDIHTLVTLPDVEESITLFHNTGALIYCDVDGNTTGYADVFTRIDAYAKHFESVGLGRLCEAIHSLTAPQAHENCKPASGPSSTSPTRFPIRRTTPMIYEMRTYTTPPGMAPLLAKYSSEIGREIRGDAYGKLEGYWLTEIGPLNQVMHLWSYKDLNERQDVRAALGKNERWKNEFLPKAGPLILRQDIRLMTAARPLSPPAGEGHVYEYRFYRTKTGKAAEWAGHINDAMPARERHSKNIGLWISIAGQPNEVSHLWAYESLNHRAAARAAAAADPDWQAFLKTAGPLLEEMHSTILIPTASSPMR